MLRFIAFRTFTTIARQFERASKACASLAGGALRLDDFRHAVAVRWESFGSGEAHVLSGLLGWEREWYARTLKPNDRILLIGSGSGRDLIALLERGHVVEGLEPSAGAVAICDTMLRRKGLTARVHVGGAETTTVAGPFDAVIFSWFAYCYILGREARVRALRHAKAALAPGGRILVSYIERSARESALRLRFGRLAARVSHTDWAPQPGDVVTIAGNSRGIHYEHHFAPGDLEDEAAAAGLTVVIDKQHDEGTALLIPR